MNRLIKSTLMAGVAAIVLTGSANVMAQQGQGRGDPAQMQQRMLERYKEALNITDEAEWKLVSERIVKVMTLRREAMMGAFGGRGGRGGPGGGDQAGARPANPEVDALRKAIESKDAGEIKAKLAALREARAKKQAELKTAQEQLKQLLKQDQEAELVLMGALE